MHGIFISPISFGNPVSEVAIQILDILRRVFPDPTAPAYISNYLSTIKL